jgi:hypothetical protein
MPLEIGTYSLTTLNSESQELQGAWKPRSVAVVESSGTVIWERQIRAWAHLVPALVSHLGQGFLDRLEQGPWPVCARVFDLNGGRDLPQTNVKEIKVCGRTVWCEPGDRAACASGIPCGR